MAITAADAASEASFLMKCVCVCACVCVRARVCFGVVVLFFQVHLFDCFKGSSQREDYLNRTWKC